jgi:hypothetical protein
MKADVVLRSMTSMEIPSRRLLLRLYLILVSIALLRIAIAPLALLGSIGSMVVANVP